MKFSKKEYKAQGRIEGTRHMRQGTRKKKREKAQEEAKYNTCSFLLMPFLDSYILSSFFSRVPCTLLSFSYHFFNFRDHSFHHALNSCL